MNFQGLSGISSLSRLVVWQGWLWLERGACHCHSSPRMRMNQRCLSLLARKFFGEVDLPCQPSLQTMSAQGRWIVGRVHCRSSRLMDWAIATSAQGQRIAGSVGCRLSPRIARRLRVGQLQHAYRFGQFRRVDRQCRCMWLAVKLHCWLSSTGSSKAG